MTQPNTHETAYTRDTTFESQYVPEQRPALLSYVAAAAGFAPPDPGASFSYLELGCSSGATLNALAAASPQAQFVGIDFIEDHVVRARQAAQNANLENVHYHQADFCDFAQLGLSDFDYIALHGTYSWLDPEAENAVHSILENHLKDGGVFFVDYMLMPGKASVAPLWRLMRDKTQKGYKNVSDRATAGFNYLRAHAGKDAKYISENTHVQTVLNYWDQQLRLDSSNAQQLAYATLSDHWNPKYSSDVTATMAALGLQFAGSTNLAMNDTELSLPKNLRPGEALDLDRVQVELIKDFYHYTQHRQDVFVKAANPPDHPDALLSSPMHVSFLWPQKNPDLSFKDPTEAPVPTNMKMVEQVFSLVRQGTSSIFDIAAQLRSGGSSPDDIIVTLTRILTFPGFEVLAQPPLHGGGTAVTRLVAANRYNALAFEKLKQHGGELSLTSDRTGGCVSLPALPSAIVAAFEGQKTADITADRALAFIRTVPGSYETGDGKHVSARAVTGQMIAPALGLVIKVILPGLIALGALKPE